MINPERPNLEKERRNELPDADVYARLKPAEHGVGVFAIKDIPAGINVFPNDKSRLVRIPKSEIDGREPEIKKMYEDFAVLEGDEYLCPDNFNNLTPSWYLNNNAENPNLRINESYDFISIRDIKVGEELVADYSQYSDDWKK